MADPWELILHHRYSGVPGLVFDRSPGRGSHGIAVGLSDDDFLADGATSGSGAINFASGGRIDVPASKSWNPLLGLRIEVVCIRDVDVDHNGTLISAQTFGFGVSPDGNLRLGFLTDPEGSPAAAGTIGSEPGEVIKTGSWTTVVWEYDGLFSFHVAIDGIVISTWTDPLRPIVPPRLISIGAHADGSSSWKGRIDDVKIWRVNPQRIDDAFTDRPVDSGVVECWAQWGRELVEVLRRDPHCAETALNLLTTATSSVVADIMSAGEPMRSQLQEAAIRYRQLWSEGRLDEIRPVLADFIAALQRAGVGVLNNADVQALNGDACMAGIVEQLRPLNCDTQFIDLLKGVTPTP
jgi:hypothetical protein